MIRRELYAQHRSRGMKQSQAYLEAGYTGENEKYVRGAAIRLEGFPEVRERINELMERDHDMRVEREEKRKDMVAFEDAMGKVEILQGLRKVFELAIRQPELEVETKEPVLNDKGEVVMKDNEPVMQTRTYKGPADNLGAANRALELMGKEEGMFIDRKHITRDNVDRMGSSALREAIEQIDAKLASIGERTKDITIIDQPDSRRSVEQHEALER